MAESIYPALREAFTGTWSTIWPVLFLPLVALWLVRGIPSGAAEDWRDPRLPGRRAALAVMMPALVAVALTAGFASRGLGRPDSFICVAKLYGPPILLSVFLGRAIAGALRRRRALGSLLKLARPASPRLAEAARSLGMRVEEIGLDAVLCFATGIWRPRVLISSGTLARLDDADLRAALLHERAHVRRGDILKAAIVSAAGDCGLLRSERALRLYRLSHEAAADAEAAREMGGDAVADVLVRFARSAAPVPAAVPLADPDSIGLRVRLLLGGEAAASRHRRWRETARLGAAIALGLYPFVAPWFLHWVRSCR